MSIPLFPGLVGVEALVERFTEVFEVGQRRNWEAWSPSMLSCMDETALNGGLVIQKTQDTDEVCGKLGMSKVVWKSKHFLEHGTSSIYGGCLLPC